MLSLNSRRLAMGALLFGAASDAAAENVTMTTYYPAPSGAYGQMITTGNTYLARDGGNTTMVGIGTTNPAAKLEVSAGSPGGTSLLLENNEAVSWKDAGGTPRRGALLNGAIFYLGDVDNVGASLKVLSATAGSISLNNGGAQALTAVGGNVGIPGSLALGGNVTAAGSITANGAITSNSNLTENGYASFANYLVLSAGSQLWGYGQVVFEDATFYDLDYTWLQGPSRGGSGQLIADVSLTAGDIYAVANWDGNATGGYVYSNGSVLASDRRLKKNIRPLSGSLDKIMKLQGVAFDWKSDGKSSLGLIAQDVESIYPDLVTTNSKTGMKGVEYANLVSPLIEAVKEQQKEIEALKAEVAALKSAAK